MKVSATDLADNIVLDTVTGTDGVTRLHVTITTEGAIVTQDFDLAVFTIIQVNARGGDDFVTVAPNATLQQKSITLLGQGGGDVLLGGRGAETLIGGLERDEIKGGPGNDRAVLGDGDDEFSWNQGDGSDVVEGRDGNDALIFNGAGVGENIDLSSAGERLLLFRGLGPITMDVTEIERVFVNPKAGPDTVSVHELDGTDVNQVDVGFAPNAIPGDAAEVDRLVVEGDSPIDKVTVLADPGVVLVDGFAVDVAAGAVESVDELQVIAAADDVVDTSGVRPGSVTIIPAP